VFFSEHSVDVTAASGRKLVFQLAEMHLRNEQKRTVNRDIAVKHLLGFYISSRWTQD